MHHKHHLARNLTPPQTDRSTSGTFPSSPLVEISLSDIDEEDEVTSPVNHNAVLVQKVIHVMDNLQEDDKQLFLIFAEAFDLISKKNKQALVNVAVTMANL